jgi:hypothetical protein
MEAFRDVARLELATLADTPAAAESAGRRALWFWENTRHTVMTNFVRLRMVLAADAGSFAEAMAEYRQLVRRCPIVHYCRRLAVLDQFVSLGYGSAREVRLVERSRHGAETLPLARVWAPPVTATGADLFWNRIAGTLHMRGQGPFSLAERPVLRRTLETLLERPQFEVTVPELFDAVWGGPYDPIRHEGKIHVTLHRLRKWLDECAPGGAQLLGVGEGTIAIAPDLDVRVLEPSPRDAAAGVTGEMPATVRGRVLQCIRTSDAPLAPRDLQRKLGVSRSALNAALRALMAARSIERLGQGRSVRYATRP